jgi:NADP-dependent 3-hydroxy acid dehydrogenase YdfG
MQDADVNDWEEMIDTNIKGLLYMTRGVVGFMITKKSGHIVNLGSVAGRWTYPGGGVYCATKFAVRALSEGLRLDLIGTPIRVTNIEPGMVQTEFSLVRLGDQRKADQVYDKMTPLSAQDLAETILWCVQRPAHVNIQELVIFPTDQAGVGFVNRR